ncbi:MAG: hypothetical protein VKN33_11065 [Candidatus Sericytochromatia bacterium]|nr:hypothetical protein [Candidatus Sericytochromatia bacterium]
MGTDPLHGPLGLLMYDLRSVSIGSAVLLFAAWFLLPGPAVAGLGRLSLLVAAGATVTLGFLGGLTGSLREMVVGAFLTVYLLFGLWARVAGLGLLMTIAVALMLVWPSVAPHSWGLGRSGSLSSALQYWLSIQYVLSAFGAAFLGLALFASAVLNLVSDRWRASPFAPVDLKFVSRAAGQWASAAFTLAAIAASVAWAERGLALDIEWLRTAATFALLMVSVLWLGWGRSGMARDGQLQLLSLLYILLLLVLLPGPSALEYLTRPTSSS